MGILLLAAVAAVYILLPIHVAETADDRWPDGRIVKLLAFASLLACVGLFTLGTQLRRTPADEWGPVLVITWGLLLVANVALAV